MRATTSPALAVGVLLTASSNYASATYSPPLNNVRIDADVRYHTVSWVTASVTRQTDRLDTQLTGVGAQYTLQAERSNGFGLQFSIAGGPGDVAATFLTAARQAGEIDTHGIWLGGQFRAYYMLWKSQPPEGKRPSALTMFVNIRGLHYNTHGVLPRGSPSGSVLTDFRSVTGGLGAMAEISVSRYFSIAPYAWITPDIYNEANYSIGNFSGNDSSGFSLRRPLLFGTDIWLYTNPEQGKRHVSLSILASLIDTEGNDDRLIAGVIGYTF